LSTNRPTQKELRAPDAFQRVGGEARRWLEQRRTLALGAVILVAMLAFISAAVSWVSNRSDEQAARALGTALKPLDRPIGAPAQGDALKPYATQAEKDQAISASLTSFRSAHSRTLAATTAALPLADAELRLGHPDTSLTQTIDFLARAPTKQVLRVSALENEGYAWEAKGQFDQAMDAFEKMSREDLGGFLAGMGLYHRARILVMQGKKVEAAKAFQELATAQPGTPAGRLAQDRLSLLAAEGIHPPVPAPAKPDAG
jgi:tetratricopeptide (TPR) repeat protein